MTGRAEVWRLKQQLDATFERVERVPNGELELLSDFARFLCVLVSGYLEKAIIELLLEHTRNYSGPSIQRFVELRTARTANLNAERLEQLLGSFDPDWRRAFETFVVDERKDAIDSVVSLRNSIAHGQSVGLTYGRISRYYEQIQDIVEYVADLCAPVRSG